MHCMIITFTFQSIVHTSFLLWLAWKLHRHEQQFSAIEYTPIAYPSAPPEK